MRNTKVLTRRLDVLYTFACRSSIIFLLTALLFGCNNSTGDEAPYYNLIYSELYSTNEDGSNIQQLTFGNNFIHYVDFIPNSNKIFFVQTGLLFDGSSQREGEQDICTYDFNNNTIDTIIAANIYQNVKYVNESSLDIPRSIVVSPDGQNIYYSNRLPYWYSDSKDIFVIDLVTKQSINLTNTNIDKTLRHFSLSFDGSKIVFSEYNQATFTSYLYIMNSDGSNKKLLASSDTNKYYFPQLLSDNQSIVFVEPDKHSLEQLELNSLIVRELISDSVYVYFYTELTRDNNLFLQKSGISFSSMVMNITTGQQRVLSIPSLSMPFFDKEGNSMLYFQTDWVLNKIKIDGSSNSLVFDKSGNLGSTHVPKESCLRDKIVFITKNTLRIKWGENK
ncbi:MAG: TolB family protein [Bacteroidota bacterium]